MNTVLVNSGGPGSSITLDPEIVSMRDRYLKALEGKPFDEMNLLIQKQLETEGEDIKRLSLLAARVYILRLRTLELRNEPTEHAMPWSNPQEKSDNEDKISKDTEEKKSENNENEWRRLRMIEAGEVNGVRFPPGIIIDVNASDGEKLVESKKAEYVETPKSDEKNIESEDANSEENAKVAADKTETDVEEVNQEETLEGNEEEIEPEKVNEEENLADELKQLSDTMSSEAEDEKK